MNIRKRPAFIEETLSDSGASENAIIVARNIRIDQSGLAWVSDGNYHVGEFPVSRSTVHDNVPVRVTWVRIAEHRTQVVESNCKDPAERLSSNGWVTGRQSSVDTDCCGSLRNDQVVIFDVLFGDVCVEDDIHISSHQATPSVLSS